MGKDTGKWEASSCSTESQTPDEDLSISKPKEISIVVESIENIDEHKVKEIVVVMEFNEKLLNESPQIPISNNRANIDLTASISAENMSPEFINEVLWNPVLFTVKDCTMVPLSNSNPETPEKPVKRKQSKAPTPSQIVLSKVVGVCNLDIGPFITGKKNIRQTLVVEPDKIIPESEVIPWKKRPKLIVYATAGDEPLVSKSFSQLYTSVGITVESVYNVPENISEGSLFEAYISMPAGNQPNKIKFSNGVVTTSTDFTFRKKWPNMSHVEGVGARTNYRISPDASDIMSDLPQKDRIEYYMQNSTRMIHWNIWSNNLIYKSDVNFFFSKIIKNHVWPIDIVLPVNKLKETSQKEKSTKSDKKPKAPPSTLISNEEHFTAFLNLTPLLYPGATRLRVAAQLMTYSTANLINTFGEELGDFFIQSQNSTPPSMVKIGSQKSKFAVRNSEESNTTPVKHVVNDNGAPTFIIVEIELSEPFCPRKSLESLEKSLKDYVSLQGSLKKKFTNLGLVENNFSQTITDAAQTLSNEYQKFYSQLPKKDEKEERIVNITKFYEYLRKDKHFFRIKKTLEKTVVDLIKEKHGNLNDYEKTLPEMYIYLVNEMHKITNQLNDDVPCSSSNCGIIQLYAEEAMEEGNPCLAKEYLLLKLSRDTCNPNYWLDLAVYYTRKCEFDQAIEAVREALCLDFHHQMGLVMYALLMVKTSNEAIAEICFEILLSKYTEFPEGWMLLYLFYEIFNKTLFANVAHQQARKLAYHWKREKEPHSESNRDEFSCETYPHKDKYEPAREEKYGTGSFRNGISWSEPLGWTMILCPPEHLYLRTTTILLKLGFYDYASNCLTHDVWHEDSNQLHSVHVYYTCVIYYLQSRYEEAILMLKKFVKDFPKDCFVWALMGHCFYELGNHTKAIGCYEYVLQSFNRPDDIHLVYSRMGSYYLQADKFSCAKQVYVTACRYSPTPNLWKGVGIACLMMEDLENAEIAFGEANCLDNKDAESWAYLAVINAKLGKVNLFRQCSLEAKKRNLKNSELITKIKSCARVNGLKDEEIEY